MTPREALNILYKGIAPNPTENNECIALCKKALNKQIPKKPYANDDGWLCCPNCGETFAMFDNLNRRLLCCGCCGQKLDWSEVDAKKRSDTK